MGVGEAVHYSQGSLTRLDIRIDDGDLDRRLQVAIAV